jgi:hypothetical protein
MRRVLAAGSKIRHDAGRLAAALVGPDGLDRVADIQP